MIFKVVACCHYYCYCTHLGLLKYSDRYGTYKISIIVTGYNIFFRDPLASLHRDIMGLQREMDLSVGQTVSPPQRSAPSDLASTSYSLDPSSLPRDLSPYSQRDLDRAMVSPSEPVVICENQSEPVVICENQSCTYVLWDWCIFNFKGDNWSFMLFLVSQSECELSDPLIFKLSLCLSPSPPTPPRLTISPVPNRKINK